MKQSLLFINLGTPESSSVKDVRSYLKEFLTDPYVINIPSVFRYLLVYGIIAPIRGPKSAHAYKKIWHNEKGSPLLYLSNEFLEKFKALEHGFYDVNLAMRYGEPSIKNAIDKINKSGVKSLKLFPLYPQYAESTTRTALDEVRKYLKSDIKLEYLPHFYSHKSYINSMVSSLNEFKDYDYTLFSYHGLPESHIKKLDKTGACLTPNCCEQLDPSRLEHCYRAQCFKTSKILAEYLDLKSWGYSFQSRFGKKWLKPFTDIRAEQLAQQGIKKLLVISPAFVTDCLETLEELHIGLKDSFLANGGEVFKVAPCLNSNSDWVKASYEICKDTSLWSMDV